MTCVMLLNYVLFHLHVIHLHVVFSELLIFLAHQLTHYLTKAIAFLYNQTISNNS